MQDAKDFQIEEYKALRKEIEIYVSEMRSQERYTVIAVGAVWGWLIINHLTHWLMWLLPLFITGASVARMVAVDRHFGTLKNYLIKTEDAFNVNGWEHQEYGRNIGAVFIILSVVLAVLALIGFFLREELARR